MDAGSVFNGLILVFGAIFGILKQVLVYVLALLCLLASPFLYLGHGLLTLALLPVRIILKFEVLDQIQPGLLFMFPENSPSRRPSFTSSPELCSQASRSACFCTLLVAPYRSFSGLSLQVHHLTRPTWLTPMALQLTGSPSGEIGTCHPRFWKRKRLARAQGDISPFLYE